MKYYISFILLSLFFVQCQKLFKKQLPEDEIIKKGTALFSKYSCTVCHSLDGTVIYGPPLNNLYLKEITVFRKNKEVNLLADREYLKKAIADPRFEKVKDYQHKEMPETFLTNEEVNLLTEYLILLNQKNKNKD